MKKSSFFHLIITVLFFGFQLQGQTSVMSFNIRYDNPNDKENAWIHRKNEVVELINHYHADFVGIQEGLLNQVNYINKKTKDYNYIGVGRNDGKTKGEFSAIFYNTAKFTPLHQETFWLSKTPNTISVGWDAALERICTYGKFINKKTQKIIHVFNTHFDHIGVKARENSAKLILKKIAEVSQKNEVIVLMGDFNSTPNSKPISLIKEKLYYAPDELKIYGPSGTFNGFKNHLEVTTRIDYIFTKNTTVTSYNHIDDKRKNNLCISDHLPVLVTIE